MRKLQKVRLTLKKGEVTEKKALGKPKFIMDSAADMLIAQTEQTIKNAPAILTFVGYEDLNEKYDPESDEVKKMKAEVEAKKEAEKAPKADPNDAMADDLKAKVAAMKEEEAKATAKGAKK